MGLSLRTSRVVSRATARACVGSFIALLFGSILFLCLVAVLVARLIRDLVSGFINDVWDDGNGAQCPNQLCNVLDWSPVQVASAYSPMLVTLLITLLPQSQLYWPRS